jgi:hypothetical protein
MEKNIAVVEFFICPHCKRAGWELVDYVPFQSTTEYACLAECDECGQEILVIDHVSRCTRCKKKVECMATPLTHTFSIASAPFDSIEVPEIKKLLVRINDLYGIQV